MAGVVGKSQALAQHFNSAAPRRAPYFTMAEPPAAQGFSIHSEPATCKWSPCIGNVLTKLVFAPFLRGVTKEIGKQMGRDTGACLLS